MVLNQAPHVDFTLNVSSKKSLSLPSLACWLRWWRTCLQCGRPKFDPWVRRIPWRREWLPTLVFLPGEFCGQRNLVGHGLWGCRQSGMTECLTLSLCHLSREPVYRTVLTTVWMSYSLVCCWSAPPIPSPPEQKLHKQQLLVCPARMAPKSLLST